MNLFYNGILKNDMSLKKGWVLEDPVALTLQAGHYGAASGDACKHALPRYQYPNAGPNALGGPDTI